LFFLPYAIPGVVATIVWSYLYSPGVGPIQGLVSALSSKTDLLSSDVILYSMMNMVTWAWVGYNLTILASGLAAISSDLYEAARIDGAGEFWIAIRIKVPLLRPMLTLLTVLSIIGTLQLFNEPYILNMLTPIPSTYTPNYDIYMTAFSYGSFNYAATLAILLACITFIASFLFLFLTGLGQGENER
jgi:multiple sugar transport system permease protein